MDKLTRLYKIMYGSMDNLFVNRREDYSHKHEDHSHLPKGLPPMTATKTVAGASTSSTHSKVSGYSSCTELSTNNQSTYLTDQSSSSSSNSPITRHHHHHHHHQHHQPSRTDASNTLPNRLHHWPEEVVSTNSQQGDSDSCYSDSYSITYKPVSVRTEFNYNYNHHQHQHHQSQGAAPVRLSPFASRALSQSSQSLPVAVANSSLEPKATSPPQPPPPSKKGSFSDLLLRKKNKKSKFNKLSEQQANRQTNQLTSSTTQLPSSSSSSSPSSTQELKISSVKDLVEVLIYQLQVMERRQAQQEVQSNNLERANKVYQAKLELATRESELLKQKLSMLESEVWQCYLCSRDKIQLYSADVCVVALICGHLFCADCSRVSREECPKCGYKYTIDRQVHL